MHGDIILNECECMVNESTLCLVFDWVDSVNGTTSKESHGRIKMVKKICAGYQQEGIDPSSGEKACQLWSDIVPNGERP